MPAARRSCGTCPAWAGDRSTRARPRGSAGRCSGGWARPDRRADAFANESRRRQSADRREPRCRRRIARSRRRRRWRGRHQPLALLDPDAALEEPARRRAACSWPRSMVMLTVPSGSLRPLATSPRRLPEPLHMTMRGVGKPCASTACAANRVERVEAVRRHVQEQTHELGASVVGLEHGGVDADLLQGHRATGPPMPQPMTSAVFDVLCVLVMRTVSRRRGASSFVVARRFAESCARTLPSAMMRHAAGDRHGRHRRRRARVAAL